MDFLPFDAIRAIIPPALDWESATPLTRGIGLDRKYRIVHRSGNPLLLRLAPVSERATKERVFALFALTHREAGIPMPEPVAFGESRDGQWVYMVLTWLDGEDFDRTIPTLTDDAQYARGVESGRLLRRIHAVTEPGSPADEGQTALQTRFDTHLTWYRQSGLTLFYEAELLRFIDENLPLMGDRPQNAVLHNDYHVGNFILQPDGTLGIIDFDFIRIGDPWEDSRWFIFTQGQGHVTMANGQLHGYFDGAAPPPDFFPVMALYTALGMFGSLHFQWHRFGAGRIDRTLETLRVRCEDFNRFQSPVPNWYRAP